MDETDYAERIRLLESKLQAMAWIDIPCQICMERDQNTTFSCDHGACKECSERLINCHICGQTIESFSSTGKGHSWPVRQKTRTTFLGEVGRGGGGVWLVE